ncbi:MAG TPA: response regulator [Bryobacteraceae bacterium]|nr:response regulator [Bryobacteraceae bacterium]
MSKPVLLIFLAEDNPGDVDLLEEALREHNIPHKLLLAKDGTEAKKFIDHMGQNPDAPCPDFILLDLNLPNASGFEIFARFRDHPLCVETPVIVVTSSDAPKDRERATQLGAARYFRKPSDFEDYLRLGALLREVAHEKGLAHRLP